ncbi:MAG: acyltransferase [Salinibacterium sp.]|nr:acyltransferase [Salinibacterium sp.]
MARLGRPAVSAARHDAVRIGFEGVTDPIVPRLRSLDGLRGVAALVVVFHHAALAAPVILVTLWPGRDGSSISQVAGTVGWRVLTFPLHLLLSAGLEAVFVFFILSGLVLTLPVLRARAGYSWLVYYPRRMIRLGIPVLGSIALAALLVVAVPRFPVVSGVGIDWLSNANSLTFSATDLLDTLNLLGPRQPLNNPLWSLGWEFAFSLLLPLAGLLAVRITSTRAAVVVIVACVAVITAGSVAGLDALVYLPMFVAGVAIAAVLPAITRVLSTVLVARPGRAAVFLACSLALIAVPWVASGVTGALYPVTVGFAVAGSLALVALALVAGRWSDFLESRLVQWLGRLSFSLYLVHVPVLVTTMYFVGIDRWLLALPLGIGASIAVAWLFSRGIELPSHHLARMVGRKIELARARRSAVTSGSDLRE